MQPEFTPAAGMVTSSSPLRLQPQSGAARWTLGLQMRRRVSLRCSARLWRMKPSALHLATRQGLHCGAGCNIDALRWW